MKKLLYLGLVVAAIYFYPTNPGTVLYKVQSSLKSIGKSEADYRQELGYKKAELAAYEKAIVDITTNIENVIASGPICPTTGRKAVTTLTEDPRDDLRAKCERLKEEIRKLEERI